MFTCTCILCTTRTKLNITCTVHSINNIKEVNIWGGQWIEGNYFIRCDMLRKTFEQQKVITGEEWLVVTCSNSDCWLRATTDCDWGCICTCTYIHIYIYIIYYSLLCKCTVYMCIFPPLSPSLLLTVREWSSLYVTS